LFLFVIFSISFLLSLRFVLSLDIIHLLSQAIISLTHHKFNSLIIAVQAAQTQFTTTFICSLFFHSSFKAFISHARTTIAVPCWSS